MSESDLNVAEVQQIFTTTTATASDRKTNL